MNSSNQSAASWAQDYIGRGWFPVPIPLRQKAPVLQAWQNLRLRIEDVPRHFSNGANLGINLGASELADVDLDCPEAIALADEFLPQTGLVFGRDGAPRSHRVYAGSGFEHEAFIDPIRHKSKDASDHMRATIVELRANAGHQTVFPPSCHPSGELVSWSEYTAPTAPAPVELQAAVAKLAAAVLLSRYWPLGARQEAALALSGGLMRAGWAVEEIHHFLAAVANAANDDELKMRLKAVDYTSRHLAAGEPTTGWPTLAKLIDADVVTRVREWLGIKDQPASTTIALVDPTLTLLSATTTSWPAPLGEAAFHGLAGDVVRTIAPHSEADPIALLMNFLITFGNVVGSGPHARAEADRHALNLFAMLVGETAKGRKGTSWGHIKELFERVESDWASNCIMSGLSSGEGMIWAVRDPIEKIVSSKGQVPLTGQSNIQVADVGISDKRLLVMEGEFATVLKMMKRDGNTLSPLIRLAWDNGNLQILTKNTPAKATNAHISLIGHITKTELLRYLNDTEAGNGFANRFLWLCVRRSQCLPEGGGDLHYGHLVSRLHDTIEAARGMSLLRRDEAARHLWAKVYPALSEGKPGLLGVVTARSEAQVLRLSALYAALDGSPIIQICHLHAALAIWKYVEASARYIFGDAIGDPVADKIMDHLRQTPQGVSRTDIGLLFGKNLASARIDVALELLLRLGAVRREPQPTTGRPREVWLLA